MEEKKMSFEEMLHRLEEIVKRLDSVETPLEESLSLFEEGAHLVRLCTETLEDARQRVTYLNREGGVLKEKELNGDL